jgi:hypothetical protein
MLSTMLWIDMLDRYIHILRSRRCRPGHPSARRGINFLAIESPLLQRVSTRETCLFRTHLHVLISTSEDAEVDHGWVHRQLSLQQTPSPSEEEVPSRQTKQAEDGVASAEAHRSS